MTIAEFSNTFDTLLNSYANQSSFGEAASKADISLDEYEKSVFLTQAQDIIVKQYFERTTAGEGFDDSTKRQVDFSSLITVTTVSESQEGITTYDSRGVIYKMPTDVLFVLNEKVTIGAKPVVVIPINYKEYDRVMSKAYTQPLKKQCWRLFQGVASSVDINSELIPFSGKTISAYTIRYVRRPKPIVLVDLTADGLDIDGQSAASTSCELNPIIHMDILNKAVELAISTRGRAPQQASE